MIAGTVNANREPVVPIPVAGQLWTAVIDTGFNGDLELPHALFATVQPHFNGRLASQLAGGQFVEEDIYLVEFPFDGHDVTAETSFVSGTTILIGTRLLDEYELTINFKTRTVRIERVR